MRYKPYKKLTREDFLLALATCTDWTIRHYVLDENSSEKVYLTVKAMDFLDYGINFQKT